MPSLLHEALVLLFRNRPSLAAELVRDALDCPVPAYDEAQIEDAALGQIDPTEYRADLVVLLRRGAPVFGIVVEVQLAADPDKRFSWPLYAAALRARLRVPACVLVVTPSEEVARWARQPIDTGQPSARFVPLVLGPGATPRITDADVAAEAPEQALLSAIAHGKEPGSLDVAVAALAGTAGLRDDLAVLYCDLVHLAVCESVRRQLEELMEEGTYEFRSDFARKYLAKGREEGRAEGRAEGEARGRAEALLTFLATRGFTVPDEARARILSCADLAALDRWISRAAAAASLAELLDED